MAWQVFKLVFEALSPLHIGAQRVGMVQRTRHYIPAMTFWGAITSRLTRRLYPRPQPHDYRTVGDFCHAHLLTSYFFPTLEPTLDGLLIPRFDNVQGEWFYGPNQMHQSEFERIFLTGYGSTAIEYEFTAAREASLHEIQLLLHQVRCNNWTNRVYFGGYLFAKPGTDDGLRLSVQDDALSLTRTESGDAPTVNLSEVMAFPQLGGERAYGYGRLKLLDVQPHQSENLWDGTCELDAGKDRPRLTILNATDGGQKIPAHLLIDGIDTNAIRGDLEAVVSRQWRSRGIGESIQDLGACFVPGSIVKSAMTVSIERYGILKAIP